jgi:hypothetical protein
MRSRAGATTKRASCAPSRQAVSSIPTGRTKVQGLWLNGEALDF